MASQTSSHPPIDVLWQALTPEARAKLQAFLEDDLNYTEPGISWPDTEENLLESSKILDQLPMGLVFLDADWKITHCLGHAEMQLGAAREEIVGQELGLFFSQEVRDEWSATLESRKERSMHQETQLVRADGTCVDIEILIKRLRAGGVSWVAIIQDITQRRELEAELRQAQKMEVLGLLTSGIAHDLNNLLTVMLGHIELAEDELSPMHEARQDMEGIRAAVDRATAMTVKLLAFARAQIVEPRPVDLVEVFNQLRPLLKQSLHEEIELTVNMRLRTAIVMADTIQLEQLLINLIINARDAIASQSGRIHVDISRRRLTSSRQAVQDVMPPGMYHVLSLQDNGSGIRAEDLARIFEPFFTTKVEGKGTGLGLATCLRIVTQNSGYICCESTPGQGTTFEIWLPASRAPQPSLPPISSLDLYRPGGSVLVVEDEPALRHSIKRALSRYGYDVEIARNGTQALELIKRGAIFDVLITDVVMPDMGGGALADKLKLYLPATPVLYISGYSDEMLATRGISQKQINFLAKPFSPSVLAFRVQELLLRARANNA